MDKSGKRVKQEDVILPRGQIKKHGGYTFIRSGKLPKDKAHVTRYLTFIRNRYIEDVAGSEENLTSGQLVLVNKLIMLEGLCRCMEIRQAEGEGLNMPQQYLRYVNSIVKICSLLGIEPREIASDVSPGDQAKIIQAEVADKEEADNG